MKNNLQILLSSIFVLFILIVNQKVFAANIQENNFPTPPIPSITVTPTIIPQNPAPPIGLTPCGKTMCLPTEICVKYPQDRDDHCVPADLNEEAKTADPIKNKLEDCWDEKGRYKGTFPPNIECWNHPTLTQNNISSYDKTCIYQPVVQYTDKRYLRGKDLDQPFEICGNGDPGPDAPVQPPGGGDDRCWVAMLIYTDVRDATLGSYGPDETELEDKTSDYLAQNYLYYSLFGRPDNLSKDTKEEYRTYWRLLPAANQANLRSYIMNMANKDLIEDIEFEFTDTNGAKRNTSFTDLYNKLKDQYTVFLHPPFIRKGCLTDYPVCPEYAKAIRDLKTPISELIDFTSKFPFPVDISPAIQAYGTVSDIFNLDVAGAYSAFTPLDFSAVRGYIVRKKDEVEQQFYDKAGYTGILVDNLNMPRYGDNKPPLTTITRETLPYIGAIHQGLLSPKFGILSSIQPNWLIDKYATPDADFLYDYQEDNYSSDFPEVKISQKNLLTKIQDEIEAFLNNPFEWTLDLFKPKPEELTFSEENLLKKGYNDLRVDNKNDVVRSGYVNMKHCPLPVSYHLLSPFTANKATGDPLEGVSKTDHHQVVYINGKHIQWAYTPEATPLVEEECTGTGKNQVCIIKKNPCPSRGGEYYIEGENCMRRAWSLTAIEDGKALTVLNNPKQSDIKKAVIEEDSFSLYASLLPSAVNKKKLTDASIDAPLARHFPSYVSDRKTAAAPTKNGQVKIFNPAEPINRINNQAQDNLHILQNCWTVPDGLQNSPRCKYELTEATSSGTCNGEAFAKITGVTDTAKPGSKAESLFSQVGDLSDEVLAAYAEAELQTGVPCEVLAGIHYREGSNNPSQDLQSGAPLAGRSLTESAIQAAQDLLAKAGGVINDVDTLIKALSYYNGGGNANCQPTVSCPAIKNNRCGSKVACDNLPTVSVSVEETKKICTCGIEPGSCRSVCNNGYVFPIPTSPGLCPPPSIGYDDPYVVELWKPEHETMYVLYTYDCTMTPPVNQNRLGTFTFALEYFLKNSSQNSSSTTQETP